jgi:hypothetical protein
LLVSYERNLFVFRLIIGSLPQLPSSPPPPPKKKKKGGNPRRSGEKNTRRTATLGGHPHRLHGQTIPQCDPHISHMTQRGQSYESGVVGGPHTRHNPLYPIQRCTPHQGKKSEEATTELCATHTSCSHFSYKSAQTYNSTTTNTNIQQIHLHSAFLKGGSGS